MNCDHYKELISAHLDGEINDEQLKELNMHLKECPDCAALKAQLEEIIQISEEAGYEHMPRELENEILNQTVRTSKKQNSLTRIFGGAYRIPKGVVWGSIALIFWLSFNTLSSPPSKLQPMIKVDIQPIEEPVQVNTVVMAEEDRVSSQTINYSNKSL